MRDAEWEKMINGFKSKGNFVEGKTAEEVTKNIKDYEGKYIYFPNFDFVKFITDKMGNKYYYRRGKSSTDLFIIK